MIALLLIWFFTLLVSYTLGVGLLSFLSNRVGSINHHHLPSVLYILTGFAALSAVLGYFSLFFPIGLAANLFVLSIVVLIIVKNISVLRSLHRAFGSKYRNPFLITASVLLFIGLSSISLLEPANYDTGLYHAQSVQWIEEFKVIPGLGNLHVRLAFNSAWFLLTALFSFHFLGLGSFHAVNGFLALVSTVYFLQVQNRFLKDDSKTPSILAASLIGAMIFFIAGESSSINPDQPVTLLLWLIFLLFILRQNQPQQDKFLDFLLILFSVLSVTIKLSALPVLLIPAYLIIKQFKHGDKRFVSISLVTALFLLLPWLVRNVILSGYLVYPFAGFDIFPVDWKIPHSIVANLQDVILAWARISYADTSTVLAMPFTSWIPVWYSRYSIIYHSLLFIAVTGNTSLILISIKAKKNRIDRMLLPFLFLLALFYWFLTAPDYRFVLGFLIPGALLPVATFLNWLINSANSRVVRIADRAMWVWSLSAVSLLLAYLLLISPLNRKSWVLPENYPPTTIIAEKIDGLTVYAPHRGDQCWYAPLPCTPYLNSGFILRGNTLQEGFRMKKSSE